MNRFLQDLIRKGENQRVDFKYCINDSRKIARTLSAFANTEGGILLLGVRDNGTIAGVNTDEEYYMIETAARIYCRPEIPVTISQYQVNGKTVIGVSVEKGDQRPYKVKGEDGKWKAYFRNNDQNLVANSILIRLWQRSSAKSGLLIKFGKAEMTLMEYLRNNEYISLTAFRKIARLPSYKAEKIIVSLLSCGVLEMDASEKGYRYRLGSKPVTEEMIIGNQDRKSGISQF